MASLSSFKITSILTLALVLQGCSTVGFLAQAVKGQLKISSRSKPVKEVLADERYPTRTKDYVREIPEAHKFAESRGFQPTLPDVEYVAWDDTAVVWVVTASEKLKFAPKTWSFPIVGSFTYLGWFDRQSAKNFGHQLEQENWDVDVRGARAYSTLGYFRDPIYSTMLDTSSDEGMGDWIETILHESVHATVYHPGQSTFNESLAEFVGDRLAVDYLGTRFGATSTELQAYKKSRTLHEERSTYLVKAVQDLETLYARTDLPDDQKAEKKRELLEGLSKKIGGTRVWNNASLLQFRFYFSGAEQWDRLLQKCEGNWGRFLKLMERLKPRFPKDQVEDLKPVLKQWAEDMDVVC
mgnify:CR=1 FL=1